MVGEIAAKTKDKLCLCVLKKVKREYSLERFNSLIRPEMVELLKNTINDCSVDRFLNKRSLLGTWRFRNYGVWFQANENFQRRNDNGRFGGGGWQLRGNIVNFSRNHPRIKIIYFDGNTLRYIETSDPQTQHEAVRMSRLTFTWHDLVGTWKNRTSTMQLDRDGNYRQIYSNPTEMLTGRWRVR